MEEVDMDGSESDQVLTGNETDESEWASKDTCTSISYKMFNIYLLLTI
jgi:hypothetical protein